MQTIDNLNETLNKEKKKVVQLEIKNEELESNARLAEASLQSVSEELELVQEELALFKIESSYGQPVNIIQEIAEPKTIRHMEVQTDSYSFLSAPTQSDDLPVPKHQHR